MSATTSGPSGSVTVLTITPPSIDAGQSNLAVIITGSGFVSGASVTFENGQGPAPSVSNVVVVTGNTITASLSASNGGPKGTRVWDVRVTNPASSSGVLVDGFSVIK